MGKSREKRIEALLSEGLNHYGTGEVAVAIECWNQVLGLDPEHAEAQDYIRTARDNESSPGGTPDAGAEVRVDELGDADPALPHFDPDSTQLLVSYSDEMAEVEAANSDGEAVAPASENEVDALLARAQEVLDRGDLEGAFDLFRAAAERDPQRLEIEGHIDGVQSQLLKGYREQVGDPKRIPSLLVEPEAVTRFDLAPEAGFVLSLVDGTTNIEELISLSPMDAFDGYRILSVLLEAKILAVES